MARRHELPDDRPEPEAPPADGAGREERRAPEPLLYTGDQLLGRTPIRLRRRTDRLRLAAHVLGIGLLLGLSWWWVIPEHRFAGPVLWAFAPGRGVHLGDLPTLLFLAQAVRWAQRAVRIVRPA